MDHNGSLDADSNGWTTVRSRKQKRKITFGNNAAAGGLTGAPLPIRRLWVSRIKRGDAQQVARYMESKNVEVKEIERVSHTNSRYNSFRITISIADREKVFQESFWPEGVKCEWWRDLGYDDFEDNKFPNHNNNIANNRHRNNGYW